MNDDVKLEEPGLCLFCEWDHPGDSHHPECVIGKHAAFAAASERARIVAWLRSDADQFIEAGEMYDNKGNKSAADVLWVHADAMKDCADLIEKGAHHE